MLSVAITKTCSSTPAQLESTVHGNTEGILHYKDCTWGAAFLICCDNPEVKCFYLFVFHSPHLPERVCDWLQVCLGDCRWSQGADWLLPGSQEFKRPLLPVPAGSPLLFQTANMCDCVHALFVNKTI